MKSKRHIGFLNVDLEIESSSPLGPLAEEMGRGVIVLYSGPYNRKKHLLSLESSRLLTTADAAARALCSVVERLSASGRKHWKRAIRREFDVGCEVACGVRAVHLTLKRDTLERIAALGATVALTCYRRDHSEQDGPANGSQPIRSETNRTSSAAGSRR